VLHLSFGNRRNVIGPLFTCGAVLPSVLMHGSTASSRSWRTHYSADSGSWDLMIHASAADDDASDGLILRATHERLQRRELFDTRL